MHSFQNIRPKQCMASGLLVAIITVVSPIIVPTAQANDSTITLSLPEAVSLGLRKNPNIRSAYLQRIADKFNLLVADDQFTPKLVLSSDYLLSRSPGTHTTWTFDVDPVVTMETRTGATVTLSWNRSLVSPSAAAIGENNSASLTITQPLLQGGGAEVATAPERIAHIQERINSLTLKTTVENTVNQIIQAYRQYQLSEGQLDIAQSSMASTQQLLKMDQQLVDTGRMARLDLLQVQATIANQKLTVIQSKNQVESARLQLLDLLALDQSSDISIDQPTAVEAVTFPLPQMLDLARKNQSAYLQQALTVETDKIQLVVAKNNRLWNLSAVGTVNNNPLVIPFKNRNLGYTAGLQLSIPIGDLGPEQGQVNADVALQQAQTQLLQEDHTLEENVRNAVREVDVNWQGLVASIEALKLSRLQLDAEKQKLAAGRSSNFEVVSFTTELQAAENTALANRIAYLNALTNLDLQAGTTLTTWNIQLNDAP